jgi:rubrerythrin
MSNLRVLIDEKEYVLPIEVANLVLEAQTFRKIVEGKSPKDLLAYTQKLHEKYYKSKHELDRYKKGLFVCPDCGYNVLGSEFLTQEETDEENNE